jgi:hypothetical protein
MRTVLGRLKKQVGAVMARSITAAPVPLALQSWAIRRLLPLDPWPKSLVYQQCLANRVLDARGAVAQAGLFAGMNCLRDAQEGCLVPKLLGCYEEELTSAAESFIRTGYDRIVDVGCASGYWLTGLALKMPKAEAYGFDIDPVARERCAEMARLNRVDGRVKLFGKCTLQDLQALIQGRTLLFVDCDGPEYELLDPEAAPALRHADIVVECHDFIDPRITPTLLSRFEQSHRIERISSVPRQPSTERYPGLSVLPREHWDAALDERRPCVQDWLVMRRRDAVSAM